MTATIISSWKIEIDAATQFSLSSQYLVDMMKMCDALKAAANMERFDFVKRPDGKFDYSFKSVDGRSWKQIIDVTNHADYSMTFNTNEEWKLSEFTPHRPLRDHVVKMAHDYQLNFIKVRFVV